MLKIKEKLWHGVLNKLSMITLKLKFLKFKNEDKRRNMHLFLHKKPLREGIDYYLSK